jgi:hypothetical protein
MIAAPAIEISPYILDDIGLRIQEIDSSVLPILTAATMSDVAAAVEKCVKAYKAVERQASKEGLTLKEQRHKAAVAFKVTMPPMDTREHVHQAIACITNGMHLEIISGQEASRLLYAAQVSLSLLRIEAGK